MLITSINLALENRGYPDCWYKGILSRSRKLIGLSWAKLKNWWRAYHRFSNLLHRCLLNLMAFVAGNFCFLTKFIIFYGLLLVDVISWILLSKNILLAILTNFLYLIQSVLFLDAQYLAKSLIHSLFYHALKYLVMLIYLYQSSVIKVNSCVVFSSILQSWILVVLIQPTLFLNLLINYFFFLLFLIRACFLSWIVSSLMMMETTKGA